MWVQKNDFSQPRVILPRKSLLFTSAAALFVTLLPIQNSWAASQQAGVVEALQKKYTLTQMTPDYEQITKDGTTMSMKCAGIYSLPITDIIDPDNKVANGKVQAPSMFTRLTLTKMGSHVLQDGDKVYVTKIESRNESGDELLKFTIVTVNALDVAGQDAQKKYKATVSFKFKKGYLDAAPPEEVEQTVESVLAPDDGSDDAQGGDNSGNAAPAQGAPQAAPAPPPPQQQAVAPPPPPRPAGPPPTITIGESSTEVLQSMGMPLQMIDLGKKKTYVYKNMKVIFLNDKVTDVQ